MTRKILCVWINFLPNLQLILLLLSLSKCFLNRMRKKFSCNTDDHFLFLVLIDISKWFLDNLFQRFMWIIDKHSRFYHLCSTFYFNLLHHQWTKQNNIWQESWMEFSYQLYDFKNIGQLEIAKMSTIVLHIFFFIKLWHYWRKCFK